jgi:transcriptional regulator with XRE-family HTH domain
MLPDRKIIAKHMRDARLSRNYSQEYMAAKMAISQNAYSKMEMGYTEITLKRFLMMAKLLDYDVIELLNEMSSDVSLK